MTIVEEEQLYINNNNFLKYFSLQIKFASESRVRISFKNRLVAVVNCIMSHNATYVPVIWRTPSRFDGTHLHAALASTVVL